MRSQDRRRTNFIGYEWRAIRCGGGRIICRNFKICFTRQENCQRYIQKLNEAREEITPDAHEKLAMARECQNQIDEECETLANEIKAKANENCGEVFEGTVSDEDVVRDLARRDANNERFGVNIHTLPCI
jgi:ribosomal protein L9